MNMGINKKAHSYPGAAYVPIEMRGVAWHGVSTCVWGRLTSRRNFFLIGIFGMNFFSGIFGMLFFFLNFTVV